MARKRVLLPLTILMLIISLVGVITSARTANAAPLSQKTHPVNAANANGHHVYLSTSSTTITALNATTGATLWTFQPGHYIDAPTTVKQTVYMLVLSPTYPTIYALDLKTGKTLWTFQQNGSVNVPVIHNAVYVTVDSATSSSSTLYKLDATTGAIIWSFQPGVQLSSAALISKGAVYITTSNAGPIYALQASNGKQIWQSQPTNGQLSAHEVAGDVLYVDGQGPPNTFGALSAYSIKDGSFLWSMDAGLWTVVNNIAYIEGGTYANPEVCALNSTSGAHYWCIPGFEITVADGLAYVVTGQNNAFSVLKASNGKQLWSNQNHFISVKKGTVYIVDSTNALSALNTTTGAFLWSSSAKSGASVAFLIANGKIYAESGNNTALYSLDAKNGALRWSFPLSPHSAGVETLTISQGIIFVLTYSNTIYALQVSSGKLLWQH